MILAWASPFKICGGNSLSVSVHRLLNRATTRDIREYCLFERNPVLQFCIFSIGKKVCLNQTHHYSHVLSKGKRGRKDRRPLAIGYHNSLSYTQGGWGSE